MTATKVRTDSLAAGFISAEILAAICTALFGAAAAGARAQLILVVFVVLGTALKQRPTNTKALRLEHVDRE